MKHQRRTISRPGLLILTTALVFSFYPVAYAQAEDDQKITLVENLDRIIEDGQGRELTLRMVKFGLGVVSSRLAQERDARFACSHAPVAGSHMDHVTCNRNEILYHLEEAGILESNVETGLGAGIFPFRTVGGEYVSRYPVNPEVLEKTLAALGPVAFNRELILAVFQSRPLPDGAPSIQELNQFAVAVEEVGRIQARFDPRIAEAEGDERRALITESDNLMIQAIEDAGLNVARYNLISELVGKYDSLRRYVAEQL